MFFANNSYLNMGIMQNVWTSCMYGTVMRLLWKTFAKSTHSYCRRARRNTWDHYSEILGLKLFPDCVMRIQSSTSFRYLLSRLILGKYKHINFILKSHCQQTWTLASWEYCMTERGQCCLSWTWARIGGLRRSPRRGTSSTCGGSTRSSFLTGRGISGTLCRVLDLLGDLEGRGQLARLGPVSLKGWILRNVLDTERKMRSLH